MSTAAAKPASEARKPASPISLTRAIADPKLFKPWFKGDSWGAWGAILKAAFAEQMNDDEIALFRSVAERDPPQKRVRELWIIAGRRAGKDSIASVIAAWTASFQSYEGLLRPGEAASILCLASDKTQARIVLNYIRSYFNDIPMLRPLVSRETALDGLNLENGIEISVVTNSFRAVRGRSIALAILDECAYWRDETSASPDVETYAALVPGMATLPNSMLVGISSPHRRNGLLYDKFKQSYGKDDADVLVIRAPTTVLNPTIPQSIVDDALARDPAAARAEWLAEWRDDIAAFLDRELLEAAVDGGVVVRPRVPGVRYIAGADPSGGVADSFCLAIAHAEGETVVVDCLLEIGAPFNPTAATKRIADTLQAYGLNECCGDRYSASWVVDAFSKCGIKYVHSERDRSAIYSDVLPLFTAGRARLLDNSKLVTQFANLERRTLSTGRDRVDHPNHSGSHDDLANSCALALVLAAGKSSGFDLDLYMRFAFGDEARRTKQ
jgi:hypothetical protein